MRDKVWKHCPSCGSRDSMKLKTDVTETFKSQSGLITKVTGLSLYICKKCRDSIATNSSDRKINSAITELKAHELSATIVAADIASVDDVVKVTGVSRQAVHQMMKDGRIQYVFVGDLRFPLWKEVKRLESEKKRVPRRKKKRFCKLVEEIISC